MVQPTSNIDPINSSHPQPHNLSTLPPPNNAPYSDESTCLPASTSFPTDSNTLAFCRYSLCSFSDPTVCSPSVMSQVVTLIAKSLQDFQTYITNNPSVLDVNPSTGLAPIQSMHGYAGFYGFMQGGTFRVDNEPMPRVEWEGKPLFDVNPAGQIYSPAGLVFNASTAGQMLQNQTILSDPTVWDPNQQGFCTYAGFLGDESTLTGSSDIFKYQSDLQPSAPSPYFNGNQGLIPSPQPIDWPGTVPYSPLPNTSSGNVVTILNSEASRFQYYPPIVSSSTAPNLGYWLNMAVLCIKAMANKETSQIPDFPIILQYTLNACNMISQETQYPLDPTTKGFFATVFSCPDPNLPGGSVWGAIQQGNPTVDVPAIENYCLGLTPSGAPDIYSSFFAPPGVNGLETFLYGTLHNTWVVYADDTSWIQGALDAK